MYEKRTYEGPTVFNFNHIIFHSIAPPKNCTAHTAQRLRLTQTQKRELILKMS